MCLVYLCSLQDSGDTVFCNSIYCVWLIFVKAKVNIHLVLRLCLLHIYLSSYLERSFEAVLGSSVFLGDETRGRKHYSRFTLSLMVSASERDSSGTSSGSYCIPDSRSLTISRIHSFTMAGLNLEDRSMGRYKTGNWLPQAPVAAVHQTIFVWLREFTKRIEIFK